MAQTIFIAIFEGVEAKNILRTPVLSTLLQKPDLRIVLFTKSEERVEYYKKEFNDPRLLYEVVKVPAPHGVDRFFAGLKFLLLRTPTTDLKRRMTHEESGRFFNFIIGFFLNRLLSRPIVRRLARFLDYHLVRNDIFSSYFETYHPDAVFLAHLFDEPEIHLLREAKRRAVFSIGLVNSWDKATARGILRLLPDKLVVFNDIVKNEVVTHNEMRPDNVFESGLPQYDIYATHHPSSRNDFFRKIGLDPRKRLIVYAPMGSAFSDVDWHMIDLVTDLIGKGDIKNAELLVRFQPNDFIDEAELKQRPGLTYDYPGRRFTGKRGIDWDMDGKDLHHLADTLYHASLIISFASSIPIDALAFDKPSINIGFEPALSAGGREGKRLLRKSPTQYYKMEHYRRVLESGGITFVHSPEELVERANFLLDNPSFGAKERAKLKKEQWQFEDGGSGERIGKFILGHLR